MLYQISQAFWQLFCITFCLFLTIFLIIIIFDLIFNTIDRFKNRKIKNQTLRNLQKDLDILIKNLDKEKK